MADSVIDNIYIINAPAGSGKTHKIRSMVINHQIEHPLDNILCITYTNRAAEELQKDVDSKRVHVSTIHSFLHSFLGIYFSHPEILNIYFEIYETIINDRISNNDNKDNVTRSNQKFIEKYGTLDLNTIKSNIKSLSYNETAFNSLYYGGLSHDDLISFAKIIFERFIVIRKRLSQKFQVIFIDEYQDSSSDVLNLFYGAIIGTSSKLYFLGDKMQQIYKNYDGLFEDHFNELNKSISLNTNYRSIPKIINVLNNLYNDTLFNQEPWIQNVSILPDHNPRILICSDIEKSIEFEINKFPDALCLYLLNKQRFDSIGSGNLYHELSKLERYSFVQKYSAVDIITDNSEENPDPLMKILFILSEIIEFYRQSSLGSILQILRRNATIFNPSIFHIASHGDKSRLVEILNIISESYSNNGQEIIIGDIISLLINTNLIRPEYIDKHLDYDEYANVLLININEFIAIVAYLQNPNVSTQHGVKGESHDTVFFIAEDSTRTPVVHMYNFLKLWTFNDISLKSFESFYYEYNYWIQETNNQMGFKMSDITAALHSSNIEYLNDRINNLILSFSNNNLFNYLCLSDYNDYLLNPIVKNAKKCFKETTVYGALSAFRLFYVGCSRAHRNLSIFIDHSKISDFSTEFTAKCTSTGFDVIEV